MNDGQNATATENGATTDTRDLDDTTLDPAPTKNQVRHDIETDLENAVVNEDSALPVSTTTDGDTDARLVKNKIEQGPANV
jgi:hypothetical protein